MGFVVLRSEGVCGLGGRALGVYSSLYTTVSASLKSLWFRYGTRKRRKFCQHLAFATNSKCWVALTSGSYQRGLALREFCSTLLVDFADSITHNGLTLAALIINGQTADHADTVNFSADNCAEKIRALTAHSDFRDDDTTPCD